MQQPKVTVTRLLLYIIMCVCNLGFMLLFLSAVTMSDIHELQQQIKQLVELIHKLASDFRAVKAELEESNKS